MTYHYGISTLICVDIDLNIVLSKIAAAGFKDIEVFYRASQFYPINIGVPDFLKTVEKFGLTVRVGHSPIDDVNCGALDEEFRRYSVKQIEESFEAFAAIGAEVVVVHLNAQSDYTRETHQSSLAKSLQSLHELSPKAKSAGIKIAMENLPRHETTRPGHSMAELQKLIADFPEHVGLCMDIGHTVISGHDPVSELRIAADRLFTLHLHDVDGKNDRHWVPGKGIINWKEFIAELDKINFSGTRIIEAIATRETVDDALKDSYDISKKWSEGSKNPPREA